MIDCARVMEQHSYYFALIEFMRDWGMNTLLFHFSDNQGCGVELPGFKRLATRHAFTAREIRALMAHAARHGVRLIPEIEVFGHTRYITDRPEYAHLYAGKKTRRLKFNALDPLSAETHRLVKQLIRATVRLFESDYVHLGCDEVDLAQFCEQRNIAVEKTWAGYVNEVIGYAHETGSMPMIWADHPARSPRIARLLRKDVVLVYWNYEVRPPRGQLPALRAAGFDRIVDAPSLACYHSRFHPTRRNFTNTERLVTQGLKHGTEGTINTIWCPMRYVQAAMYYGIAYSAEFVRAGGQRNLRRLRTRFAKRVLGARLTAPLNRFLAHWPDADLPRLVAQKILKKNYTLTAQERATLRASRRAAELCITQAARVEPTKNHGVWNAMRLSVNAAWVCCEGLLLAADKRAGQARRAHYRRMLKAVRSNLAAEWDATRFADDPLKRRPAFPGADYGYALLIVRALPQP